MNFLINSALTLASNQLKYFSRLNNFWQVFDTAFGTQYNRSVAEILRLQWETGDFSQLPQIEVLDSSILGGANGAYASSKNKIYLSNTFVASASLAAISGVLLEEIGHFVDSKINQTDGAGDEGAIFAELVQGYSLNTQTFQALKSEDDHATITVNGEVIQVEQQNFTGTNIFGTDTITGSSGDDTISPLRGQDQVDGGAGNDVLVVDYSSNTYTGTSPQGGISSSVNNNGNGGFNGYYFAYDNTNGSYDQVSFSNIERFQITGTGANDNIITGDGNDTINGGNGDDVITGGAGINVIDGGAGIDTITDANFSSATTALSIDDSNTAKNFTLPDGTTITNIERFTGLITGSGNDVINFSQRINKSLNTGNGDDTINAGLGQNQVDGGAGNDVLVVDYSSNTYTGTSPQGGISSSVNNNGNGGFNGYYFAYDNTNGSYDQVSFSNIERFQITGTGANDNIITGDGNDTINGGNGDDVITGGAGINVIDGGAGIDTITDANFSSATTALSIDDSNTAKNFTLPDGTTITNIERFTGLITGSGNDVINFSQRINKSLNTGNGDDTINAGLGQNQVDGGAGNDVLVVDYSSNTYTGTSPQGGISSSVNNNGNGGFNGYYFAYDNTNGSYDQVSFSNIERFQITGTGANDNIITGDGNDTINGGNGDDVITGGAGINVIDGGAGIDTITDANFSSATTALSIDDSNTAKNFTLPDGTTITNIERFTGLITGSGNDVINFSQRINKSLNTGNGDDTINAGLGQNQVDGGAGNDVLVVDYSSNTYTGTSPQGGISSSVNNNGNGGFNGYYFAYDNTNGSYDQVSFSNIERFQITGTGANDNIITGDGNDTINGGNGDDVITGGAGINVIDGGAGIDTITDANFSSATTALSIDDSNTAKNFTLPDGTTITNIERFTGLITGSGNDVINFSQRINKSLNTGNGDDTINAGLGQNQVDGGAGNDVLVVDYSSNTYTGTSPQGGISSSVNNNGNGGFNGYYFAYDNTNGSYDQVSFSNIERFQITGTGANDNIITGDGNDTINGGNGDDVITGGAGINVIDGGAGIDTITDANFSSATTALSIDDSNTAKNFTLPDGTTITNIERFTGLITGSGNDVINFSQRINKSLNTGNGDDTINAGLGQNQVDGGAGNDVLVVDYSSNTYTGTSPQGGISSSVNNNGNGGFNGYYFAYDNTNGSYDQVSFSNIERFQITGTGANDNIITGDGNDTINGGNGDDVITGGAGINVIDGGAGIDTITDANFSSATTALSIDDSNTAKNFTLPDGTTITNIERFTGLITGSGNDVINFSQRINKSLNTGNGDDTINAGLGQNQVDGGAGNDVLVVDYSSNTYTGTSPQGGISSSVNNNGNGGFNGYYFAYDNTNGNYDQVNFSNIERFQITGTGANDNIITGDGNDTINGGNGNDTIDAGGGNDTINGVNGASLTPGLGEIDSLTGGAGSDIFILGNATKVYYDDGNTLTNGSNDYADITDLNIGDIIQLQGTSSNYLLAVVGADTQILINKPNTEPDELIGIVRNQTGLSLTGTYFSYVFDNTPPTNQAPTNITLNNSTIAENQAINTVVGNFTTTDPNTGDTFTYSLVSGTGDTNNNSFIIVGNNELQTKAIFDYETKNSYSVRVKTTDQGGLSFEKQLTIGVTDVNETPTNQAPTNISLNNSTIAENQAINTVVGNFTAIDPDAGNTFTYTLVSGTGDTDNNVFTITNNELKTNSGFDYETKNSYSIRIKTTDQGGLSFEKQLTIGVTDVNEVPVITSPTTANFAENGTGTVYTVIATDVDAGTPLYSLSGTDASLFNISNGNVNFKNAPNFELPSDSGANNVYDINVIASDGSLTATQAVAITVTNVNEVPSNLTLSNSTIAENQAINTVVGNFTTIDPDEGDTFTYTLVSGTGDTDNNVFTITNNELKTNSGFDYESKNSYSIRVKTTDQGGLSFEKQLTIGVTDVNETVANLSISPSNVTQTEGNSGTKAFTFTVTRSEDTSGSSSANWAVTGSGTDQADVTDFGGTFPTSTVVFAAGETTKTIIVDVLGDTTVEPDEGFTVTLSNPTNATITTATAVGTITNDDRTLTPITDYAPNVNISTGLIFSTNGGGNLSLDTNRLSASNEVTSVQNGTKSNFNHLFGIYEVVDAEGGINTEKGVLKPGDSDYALYALTAARVKDFIVQAGSSDTPSTATQLGSGVSLQGNKFYAPFVIANCGTYFPNLQQGVEDFVAAENGDVNRFANAPQYVRDLVATEAGNEFNNAPRFLQEPVAYFSFGSANPDKSPHLRSYGNGVYGFEDLPATATQYSNNDFNDAVFALS